MVPPFYFVSLGMEIKDVVEMMGDKIFTVTFIKKDGTVRVMNARRGVSKGVKGVGMSFDPTEKDLITVYDMTKGAFRMVNAKTITELKASKKVFKFKDGQLVP